MIHYDGSPLWPLLQLYVPVGVCEGSKTKRELTFELGKEKNLSNLCTTRVYNKREESIELPYT